MLFNNAANYLIISPWLRSTDHDFKGYKYAMPILYTALPYSYIFYEWLQKQKTGLEFFIIIIILQIFHFNDKNWVPLSTSNQ